MIYKLNDREIFATDLKNIPSTDIDVIIYSMESQTVYKEKHGDSTVGVLNIITMDEKAKAARPNPVNPLYIIDGKEATKSDLDAISQTEIDSVYVYKDARAIVKFGERGISGVVDVVTKKH